MQVYYDEDFVANFDRDKSLIRNAICIIQTETDVEKLLQDVPKDVNSLALIQGSDSGNKSIKFSYLLEFQDLTVLELQGVNIQEKNNISKFICDIDVALPLLEYINLENVELKSTRSKLNIIENEIVDEVVTFDYVQKINPLSKPLTFIRVGSPTEILPYNKYIEQNFATFKGFSGLTLLRIFDCNFNNLHWEMFEGLSNLNYLLLEKNNLKFVPDFAFYGTGNVKTLSLAHNSLLNIQIRNLAGLLELEYLDLSHNNFSQLSELSLPPFPKLKLANFGNNPINAIFPNTFEVMNTTDSIILGGEDTPLTILTNSFLGLKLLKKLALRNLQMESLEKEIFVGMPNLNELILSGDIPKIEFDAFLEVYNLERLILNNCNISKISIDAFMGLNKLKVLDLSRNNLETLPYGVFDVLTNLRELYLNHNKFKELPKGIFSNIQVRLIRLNNNPWHCTCAMSDWKPVIINRIKQKTTNGCDQGFDKGLGCSENTNDLTVKYVYENSVAPRCVTPRKYKNWNVFHVLRKQLKCLDFKPKIKKMKLHKLKKLNSTMENLRKKNAPIDKTTTEKVLEITTTEKYVTESTHNLHYDNNINNNELVDQDEDLNEFNSDKLSKPYNKMELNNLYAVASNTLQTIDNNLEPSGNDDNFIERQRKPLRRRYKKKMYRQNMFGKMKKVDM